MGFLWLIFMVFLQLTTWVEAFGNQKSSMSYLYAGLHINTTEPVYHMEIDKYLIGRNFLISSTNQLQTANRKETVTLLSDVRFLSGFTQINSTLVAFVECLEHCVKVLHRDTNAVQVLAGRCGVGGYKEGKLGRNQFYYPYGVVLDIKNANRLFISDRDNSALRAVDLITKEVNTVICFPYPNRPFGLRWADQQLLVVIDFHYINHISWLSNGTAISTLFAGLRTGFDDILGSLDVAEFSTIHDIEAIGRRKYLVVDRRNYKLKLIDLSRREVGPVCLLNEEPCTKSTKFGRVPISLLIIREEIYLGMENNIYKYSSTPVLKRLEFNAIYQAPCSYLQRRSFKNHLLDALNRRKRLIQVVCAHDCVISTYLEPYYTCSDNFLTVFWPTDNLFHLRSHLPMPIQNRVKNLLNLSPTMQSLGIHVPSANPPVVDGIPISRGEYVGLVLTTTCADETKLYDSDKGTCS